MELWVPGIFRMQNPKIMKKKLCRSCYPKWQEFTKAGIHKGGRETGDFPPPPPPPPPWGLTTHSVLKAYYCTTVCTDSPIQGHFTGDTGALPLTVSSRLTTVSTESPIQSHFTGDTGALPLTVSSRFTTVLLCALIALYRAISLVILGPYHSQCPQGLLLYYCVH